MKEAERQDEPGRREEAREGERLGVFPSWGWLYGSVIAYTALLVLALYLLTVYLDFSSP